MIIPHLHPNADVSDLESHADLAFGTTRAARDAGPEEPIAVVALLLRGEVLKALLEVVVGELHANAQVALAVAAEAAATLVDEEADYSGGRVVGVLPAAGVLVACAGAVGGQGGRGEGG